MMPLCVDSTAVRSFHIARLPPDEVGGRCGEGTPSPAPSKGGEAEESPGVVRVQEGGEAEVVSQCKDQLQQFAKPELALHD